MADVFAGRTNIEAHEALATRAEHLAIVEGKVGLVDEEVEKGIVRQSSHTRKLASGRMGWIPGILS